MSERTPEQGMSAPRVRFHFNVGDRLAYVHSMLSKTARLRLPASVLGPKEMLDELSRRLWTANDTSFIAHQRWPASPSPSSQNRIWLIDVGGDGVAGLDGGHSEEIAVSHSHFEAAASAGVAAPVLINLSRRVPLGWPGLTTLVEVVPMDADERDAGRRRWKTYQAQGLTIEAVDARGENGA
jgi:DNA polymerase-3 subunit chi